MHISFSSYQRLFGIDEDFRFHEFRRVEHTRQDLPIEIGKHGEVHRRRTHASQLPHGPQRR